MYFRNITGIILAGGKSTRMGVDKSLLKINDKTLVEISFDKLSKIFHRVLIISDNENKFDIDAAEQFKDIFTNAGPLGGIHSGLKHSDDNLNFILSCDMPLITTELITHLCEQHGNNDITIPQYAGQNHFLCGVYSRSCLPNIERKLNSGINYSTDGKKNFKFSLKNLIASLQANIINADNLHFSNTSLFYNVNTPEDLEFIRLKISE